MATVDIPINKGSELSKTMFNFKSVHLTKLEDMLKYMVNAMKTEIEIAMRNLDNEIAIDEAAKAIIDALNMVELGQFHLEFILEVLLSNGSEEEVAALKKKHSLINHGYEKLRTKEDITQVPAKHAIIIMHDKMFLEFKKTMRECFKKSSNGEVNFIKSGENVARLKITAGRFRVADRHYPWVFTLPKDDIFCYERTSQIWQDLYKVAEFKEVITEDEVNNSSRQLHLMVRLIQVIVKKHFDKNINFNIKLAIELLQDIIYYGVQHTKAETQALFNLIDPSLEEAFVVWNITENPFIAQIRNLRHPIVGHDARIYVPRLFPAITRDLILKEYKENTFNKLQPMDPALFIGPKLEGTQEKIIHDLYVESDDKIPIRILASEPLSIGGQKPGLIRGLAQKTSKLIKGNVTNDDTAIVIHIHGGGFVSMSSFSHKTYLTRWARNLKLIYFCIDYRLAPKNQYPDGLDDVWQAYHWIVNYTESVLGIRNQRILLSGDSAGGNLALSLMYRLIKAGLKVPCGCLLMYPSLYVDANSYSPSYFLSVDNPLLPYTLLKLVAKAYVPEGFKNTEDPCISPMLASDELMEKLPPIRIVVGSKDPLYDDNWRLVYRLTQLQKNVKIIVHEHLSHAFLCDQDIKHYELLIKEACDLVRELLAISS